MSIFISYRRDPSAAFADALCTELQRKLQQLQMPSWEDVFRDETSIAPGSDFVSTLFTAIPTCDLFIAIVDDSYFGSRFDDETDFVRRELLLALSSNRTIVPIVIKGTEWPPARPLPEETATLKRIQAIVDVTQTEPVAQRIVSLYRSHRLLDECTLHKREIKGLAIAEVESGAVIVSADEDTIRFTALSTGAAYRSAVSVRETTGERTITAIAIEGRGKDVRVVVGLSDSSVALYELATGTMLEAPRHEITWTFDPNRGPLVENGAYTTAAIFVRNRAERRLVYANSAGQISLFPEEVTDGLPVFALGQIRCRGTDALVVAGREELPASLGEFISIRDLETGAIFAHVVEDTYKCFLTVLGTESAGQSCVISGDQDGNLRMWDCDLKPLTPKGLHSGGVSAVAEFNGILISGGADGSVQAWRIEDLKSLGAPRQEHKRKVKALACATIRNRHVVASGSEDGSVRAYLLEGLIQVPDNDGNLQ